MIAGQVKTMAVPIGFTFPTKWLSKKMYLAMSKPKPYVIVAGFSYGLEIVGRYSTILAARKAKKHFEKMDTSPTLYMIFKGIV